MKTVYTRTGTLHGRCSANAAVLSSLCPRHVRTRSRHAAVAAACSRPPACSKAAVASILRPLGTAAVPQQQQPGRVARVARCSAGSSSHGSSNDSDTHEPAAAAAAAEAEADTAAAVDADAIADADLEQAATEADGPEGYVPGASSDDSDSDEEYDTVDDDDKYNIVLGPPIDPNPLNWGRKYSLSENWVVADREQRLLPKLQESTLASCVTELGRNMASAGLQGSVALGLGYLLLHRSLLDSFSWSPSAVGTGLLWAAPAATLALLITALPLPTAQQQLQEAAAAAAPAGSSNGSSSGSGSSGSGSSSKREPWADALEDVTRMATVSAYVSELPIRVNVGGGGGGGYELLTPLTPSALLQSLRFTQEFLVQPWKLATYSARSWAASALGGLLKRTSVELFWRGLVVAGLGGWLYSSWETAGSSQDSPLFYARLFGLLTPQAALGVISAILLATRLPADSARIQPAVTYTRLSSMQIEVVGRLTEEDWLVMVLPADVAAAAAAAAGQGGDNTQQQYQLPRKPDLTDVEKAITQNVQRFGRMKGHAAGVAAAATAGSSSSGSNGSSREQQQRQQPLSRQEMEQQLDKLLAAVQEWQKIYSSSTTSSSSGGSSSSGNGSSNGGSSSSSDLQGFKLTPREAAAAELVSEFLELVKSSAAAKAAAAAATSSRYVAKSAGVSSSKLANGLESLLLSVNKDPQRRLFLLHVEPDTPLTLPIKGLGKDESLAFGDESSDDSSDDEEDDSAPPGSVQALMKARARGAAADVRAAAGAKAAADATAAAAAGAQAAAAGANAAAGAKETAAGAKAAATDATAAAAAAKAAADARAAAWEKGKAAARERAERQWEKYNDTISRVKSTPSLRNEDEYNSLQSSLKDTLAMLEEEMKEIQQVYEEVEQQHKQEQQQQQAGQGGDAAGDINGSSSGGSSFGDESSSSNSSGSSSSSSNGGRHRSRTPVQVGQETLQEGMSWNDLLEVVQQQAAALHSSSTASTSDLASYLKARKGAYKVAATFPTAQDQLVGALQLSFCFLEQLALAGAFVGSGGNLAASLAASAGLCLLTTSVQQGVANRERARLRQQLGVGWSVRLQPFQDA